ncbi:MAG TPA: hypothetical protein VM733_21190 [Thermoanaerobaculia bacterium]|nr:hypothetical protein [Thermoanaerobaculia bacterium]
MTDRLRWIAERVTTAALLLAAVALLVTPRLVARITGVRESPRLAAPDDLPPLSKEDASPFFATRNEIEIRVAEATTLRQFLDRNRLNKPYHREQIVGQLGTASPEAPIAAGTVFHLSLTPVAADVPGARPKAEETQ